MTAAITAAGMVTVLIVTIALPALASADRVTDEALVTCVRGEGFADFAGLAAPATLKDGSTWAPDEHGRFEITPATVELMNAVERCREDLNPGSSRLRLTDAQRARIEFLNSYHAAVYACMAEDGWAIGDPVEDMAGMQVYGLPEDLGEEWQRGMANCQQVLYGEPGFPRHLMPGQ